MSYFMTHSGKKIDLTSFKAEDVCLDDIAHGLAKICRYGSALPLDVHYSVAKHSVYLCEYVQKLGGSEDLQRACLMHDAAESYLGDVVRGLKDLLPDYKKLEEMVEEVIFSKYLGRFNPIVWDIVKDLDKSIDQALIAEQFI